MANDRGTAVVVRSIVRLAHGLGLRTVGEGVETEHVARSLMALGCDELQGYLFGQPVTIEEMLELLSRPANLLAFGPAVARLATLAREQA